MKFLYLLILLFMILGCGQKKGPAEIVRLQKGTSLMRQVAPTLRRGSKNVFLIGENVTDKELNNYLNSHNRNKDESKFQKLYISGPKAKSKRKLQGKLTKINNKRYDYGVNKKGSGMVIKKRKHKVENNKNLQDNLHKK